MEPESEVALELGLVGALGLAVAPALAVAPVLAMWWWWGSASSKPDIQVHPRLGPDWRS